MINIPEDLILNLIKFLDVKAICNFNSVNKHIYNINKTNNIYVTNLLIENSKFSFHEFENNNCFRYVKNNNSHVFSFCKNKNLFTSKKDYFIKARKSILKK